MGTQLPLPIKGAEPPIFGGPFLLWPYGWIHQYPTWYGGRPQPGQLCGRWGPNAPPRRGGAPNFRRMSIVVKRLHIRIKMSLGTEVGLSLRDIVRRGPSSPPLKVHSPQFSANVRCGQTAGMDGLRCDLVWRFSLAQATLCSMGTQLPPEKEQMSGCIKMPLGTEVGISPGNFVVDGDRPTPLPKKGRILQFSAHIYCGQTAAWIKMSLGMEIGLGLRDTVLDGDPAPPPPKVHNPQFSANVRCGQMAGWIKIPLGTEVNLGPGDIVLDGVAAPLEGAQFSLHLYCSQTAGWTKTPLGTEV